jgi:hypothetical protein
MLLVFVIITLVLAITALGTAVVLLMSMPKSLIKPKAPSKPPPKKLEKTPKKPTKKLEKTPKKPTKKLVKTPKKPTKPPTKKLVKTPKKPTKKLVKTPKKPSKKLVKTPKKPSKPPPKKLKKIPKTPTKPPSKPSSTSFFYGLLMASAKKARECKERHGTYDAKTTTCTLQAKTKPTLGPEHATALKMFQDDMMMHPTTKGDMYTPVMGPDGLIYHMAEVNPTLLNALVKMNAKLTRFASIFAKSRNPYIKKVVEMIERRDRTRLSPLCGALKNEQFSHAYGSKWIFLKSDWATKECNAGRMDQCFGIVLHELAHNVCFSPPLLPTPGAPSACLSHGSTFCRVQAHLVIAAKTAGLYKSVEPYRKEWDDRLKFMVNASYPGDNIKSCDDLGK